VGSPDQQDDQTLAAAAARGDAEALDRLLARHVDRVYAVCRRVLGNEQDSLDATQDALLAIARGIRTFDARARFTTWCYRVATNAALDEVRRRTRRPLALDEVPERPAPDQDPSARVADAVDVDTALRALPPEYRAAVALRDLAGFDYADIAAILEIPPGTVRSRIARGRAALADRLAPRETGNRAPVPERPTPRTP
jgi:RNA polymerase sigma-70 factor (ECF subfamily)